VSEARVVSLVPSATETLLAWGVVPIAVTRFCEQPSLVHVGGTKDPDVAAIVALAPDVVILCEEENRVEDADALAAAGLECCVLRIDSLDDVGPSMTQLASAVGAPTPPAWTPPPVPAPTRSAFVPIWRRPWMTMSSGTYGASLLAHLGVANAYADASVRYPTVTLEDAASRRPEVVLAPSEPYPFAARHVAELEAVAPVELVDGQDLFWWGARTPDALVRLTRRLG
jgi:ABC-type Fe3+-hydroxamate transport system substrate-binding protein